MNTRTFTNHFIARKLCVVYIFTKANGLQKSTRAENYHKLNAPKLFDGYRIAVYTANVGTNVFAIKFMGRYIFFFTAI